MDKFVIVTRNSTYLVEKTPGGIMRVVARATFVRGNDWPFTGTVVDPDKLAVGARPLLKSDDGIFARTTEIQSIVKVV